MLKSSDSSNYGENRNKFRMGIATREPEVRGARAWEQQYIRGLRITDTLVIAGAVLVAQWARVMADATFEAWGSEHLRYTLISIVLAVLWLSFLAINRTRSPRVVGSGPEEYRRVVTSTVRLFGLIAMGSLLLKFDLGRGYLAVGFSVGLMGILVGRRMWRRRIAAKRVRGLLQTSIILIGSREAVAEADTSFARDPGSGYRVVGACVPNFQIGAETYISSLGRDIPIYGDESCLLEALKVSNADTVVVSATEYLGLKGMRKLVWDLEPFNVDLVVSPGVIDISGPRLEMRPVSGFPLIHIEKPQYHGAKKFGKKSFDVIFALLALAATAPLIAIAALAIKIDNRGPAFYISERIGLGGVPFRMFKLRSMVVDADSKFLGLMHTNEVEGGVLFKVRDDPRMTRVGSWLRRYSIDELPQFLNVLRGEMSVVGPRPPLLRETEAYDDQIRRRLLVKPGLTGLWQTSGRSDLPWDETVRLDLLYVENWSLVQDLLIVVKTVRTVIRGDGAY